MTVNWSRPFYGCRKLLSAPVLALGLAIGVSVPAATPEPLALESKIPLGDVRGRIDHLTIDIARNRLYVAELGNDSIGVVDLKERRVLRTLTGFREPQGIAYVAATDTVYVANGGDGSVRLLHGPELTAVGRIDLGDDADNVRVDRNSNRVWVGYGSGAFGVVDTMSRRKIASISLKAHPESFQIDESSQHIFVNVPDAHEIAVVDPGTGKQTESWLMHDLGANFPMAIDEPRRQVLVVFRSPPKLGVFDMAGGASRSTVDTCEDADDVFVDAKRARVYVTCGAGFIDVLTATADGYTHSARVATMSGARTALFVPELDRLFVAVRASSGEAAAIWVFRPEQ